MEMLNAQRDSVQRSLEENETNKPNFLGGG